MCALHSVLGVRRAPTRGRSIRGRVSVSVGRSDSDSGSGSGGGSGNGSVGACASERVL
jgi:hypothetical protein